MALIIRWTPRASAWLNTQFDYWDENNVTVASKRFVKDLDKKISIIAEHPEVGRATSAFKKIRFVTIDKRYHLFYRIQPTSIILLTFFDTKQNQSKRPY